MTKKLQFTEASLQRVLRAASKSGFRVVAVRPDGTVMLDVEGLDQACPVKHLAEG